MKSLNEAPILELIEQEHAREVYELAASCRDYLRKWLPWPDQMQDVSFIEGFIEGSLQRRAAGMEYGFVIRHEGRVVGRTGIYKIDPYNRCGEIGYWLGDQHQGKGIATQTCIELARYGFEELQLNRLEIRCASGNSGSQAVAEKAGFRQEGILRQAEWLRDHFNDLYVYGLCKNDLTSEQTVGIP
jgi:ribosomal-protein-serine acetyltransferase